MPKSDKPNILVIWGDDIGIANLRTPITITATILRTGGV
jgi:arylsulfatase A-like enzyme